MTEESKPASRDFRPDQAELYYKKGLELKNKGQTDQALTEFRRAVLSDGRHAPSHFEIGMIVKTKAGAETRFLRYAYESFQQAARLDINNQAAHDQYIMMGQKLGLLEDLHKEYGQLSKTSPENPLFQRCAKNIVTLSMALIPDQGSLSSGDQSRGIRKILFFASISLFGMGLVLCFSPVILRQLMKRDVSSEQARGLVTTGLTAMAAAGAGFFTRAKLH